VLRPLDFLRRGPAVSFLLLSACGHIGIDLEADDGAADGSGANALLGTGGTLGSGASGGESGASGGESSSGGSGDGSSGGDGASGGTDGDGGVSSGGASGGGGSGGTTGTGGSGGTTGAGGQAGCEGHANADFSLAGWASEAGGTTGGKGGTTVTVWAGGQLQNELLTKNPLTPLTLLLNNTISPNNTGDDKIDIANVSDVSIIGVGDQGVFAGIGLRIINSSNIVIRNVHIHHVDIGEMDAISLAGPADHIWIDHCEFDAEFQSAPKGTYDGLIDAKANVSYVTYSWNYIHDSWDPILVGSTEMDTSDRRLTMHHNRIQNCDAGSPSFRGGNGHIFNNLYEDIATMGINSRVGACLRIESNVFSNVMNPWVSAFSASLGSAEIVCNRLDEASTFDFSAPDVSQVEQCVATVPYDYAAVLNETASVADLVTQHAGFGKLTDPEDF
jgi:pectate lyase